MESAGCPFDLVPGSLVQLLHPGHVEAARRPRAPLLTQVLSLHETAFIVAVQPSSFQKSLHVAVAFSIRRFTP